MEHFACAGRSGAKRPAARSGEGSETNFPVAIKRIIPISSGKGGVGKTTFAVNFSLALSRFGRTVLIDLDTGTSSVRNAIDTPIERDLYHFFKRGETLSRCITQLDRRLDPHGKFDNFGFVAGPLHLIEGITNFGPILKRSLIDAINSLDAEYVVLDMKAGLDSHVIDFLPFSNSGILIFTPHLPSATLAASDIVKAILFRKLRLVFGKESPFFSTVDGRLDFWKLTNDLIDQVEDVYDTTVQNLEGFASDLYASLGDHPITRTVQGTIDSFRTYYVLNLFHGVDESFDTAVKPFIENLTRNVSPRVSVTNLGWVTRSDEIHKANVARIPALLDRPGPRPAKIDRYLQELEDLRITAIGLEPARKTPPPLRMASEVPNTNDHLSGQLDVLRSMFNHKRDDDFRANFDYITQRALFTIQSRRPGEFGDSKIYSPKEMLEAMYARSTAGK